MRRRRPSRGPADQRPYGEFEIPAAEPRRRPHAFAHRGSAASGSTLARIRAVIGRVPRGRVVTYGTAAEVAGFPRGARLTVRALYHGDRLPWHRVVAAGGRIALPGLDGREQRLRLALEGVSFRAGRVRMDVHAWPRRRSKARGRLRSVGGRRSSPL